MLAQTGRFQTADRLLRSREFERVIRRGRRVAGGAFVVICAPRQAPAPVSERNRIGITVSRKVGNAVVRNRVKRRIREWFRAERDALGAGFDLVVIGRAAASRLPYSEISAELSELTCAAARASRPPGAA